MNTLSLSQSMFSPCSHETDSHACMEPRSHVVGSRLLFFFRHMPLAHSLLLPPARTRVGGRVSLALGKISSESCHPTHLLESRELTLLLRQTATGKHGFEDESN